MTNKSGTILTEAWGDENNPSPIHITGDCVMGADQTLRILPGTEVISDGNYTFTATDGSIIATGERGKPVIFKGASEVRGGWVGLVSASSSSDKIQLQECEIWYASKGVHLNASEAILKRVRFFHNTYGMYLEGASNLDDIEADGCWFEENEVGLYFHSDCPVGAGQYFEGFRFVRNATGVEMADGLGVISGHGHRFWENNIAVSLTGTYTDIDLTGIWWGSDSGPYHSVDNAEGTGDEASYTSTDADITPWTELKMYVPLAEDVRRECSRLLGEEHSGAAEKLALITDEEIEGIVERKERVLDSWFTDSYLDKKLFAHDTETNETHDIDEHNFFSTDYRPIVSISSVEKRTGSASWASVTENEYSGWYSSGKMRESGMVRIVAGLLSYRLDSVRLTYVHGYYDAPEKIREPVLKMVAIDLYQRFLQFGENDVFAQRVEALKKEIEEEKADARRSTWWMVV